MADNMRKKNLAVLAVLAGLVLLLYLISMVKIAGQG